MSRSLVAVAVAVLTLPALASAASPSPTELDLFRQEASAMRAELADKAGPVAPGGLDTDSFGRNVKWDGLLQAGVVTLLEDCTPQPGDPPAGPDDRCVTLNAAPAATAFDLPDIGRLTVPGRAASSLLCHWLTPILFFNFANPTGVAQPIANFQLTPYVTIESSELADPALIDPTTGLPFNGKLETGFAATYQTRKNLGVGETLLHRESFTRACINGFLSKRALVDVYGLTQAQANAVFRKDITLRFGVRGRAQLVSSGSVIYGLRVVGD